jgi:hypothetical protein
MVVRSYNCWMGVTYQRHEQTGLIAEASKCLAPSETGAKKKLKVARESRGTHRFQPGLEWEVLQADAVVLLGLTNALRYVPALSYEEQLRPSSFVASLIWDIFNACDYSKFLTVTCSHCSPLLDTH